MRIRYSKRDAVYFVMFVMLFILMTHGGASKYVILIGIAGFLFLLISKTKQDYFIVVIHVFVYIALGMLLAIITGNLTFESIKQCIIFMSAPLLSISIFTIYGEKDSNRLVDLQFWALCLAYIIMYARYFSLSAFYFESCFYAYIFGVYVLLFFMRKQYKQMFAAIIFMLADHKRIVNAAVAVAFICLLLILIAKRKQIQNMINIIAKIFIFAGPVLWVILCSNGLLSAIFAAAGINTMGRLEGTGAWNIAKDYYEISLSYIGKGSGWVLNWLENANIPAFSNLHNDFLTAYIELGCIGFILWLLIFCHIIDFVKMKSDIKCANVVALLIGFMFINLLTDNIYIYITFLVPFYVVLLDIIFGNEDYVHLQRNLKKRSNKNK